MCKAVQPVFAKERTLSEPEIKPSLSSGEFYISRTRGGKPEYLHSDGKWRETTRQEKGQYTGYYPSMEVAQQMLKSYWPFTNMVRESGPDVGFY
jgi:hypothetical protein